MQRLGKFASVAALMLAATPVVTSASVLYSEDFDTDHTANWTFNSSISGDTASQSDAGGAADFYFDYSTVGIPAAPGGSSTRGMRIQANLPATNGGAGTFSGSTASPLGLTLPSEYKLSAYVWLNTVGPFPLGGSGSTQLGNVTVGASGTVADFAGGTLKGVQFSTTMDGQSTQDWRAYNASGAVLGTASGVYAASGTTGMANSNAYYSVFSDGTNLQAPAAQISLYPNQTGNLAAGVAGFKWRLWEVTRTNDQITWSVDGTLIATVPASLFPAAWGGDNISFGTADITAGSSTDTLANDLQFTLVDNITVSSVPEPASLSLLGLGAAALFGRRRRMA
jgi:hypothetical protein